MIDKVTLSFAHQEQVGGIGPAPTITLVVIPGGGGSCSFPLTVRPSLTTDTIDLASCLSTPTKLNGATYAYQLHLNDTGNVSQSVTASVDGLSAAVISTDTANQTFALSSPAPAVPAGATIDSSVLSFAHQETGGTVTHAWCSRAPTSGAAPSCTTINLTPRPSLTTDTFDLNAQLRTNCGIAAANIAATINGMTVTYVTNLTAVAGDGTSQAVNVAVDGLKVVTVSTDASTHTLTLSAPTPAVPATTLDTVTVQIAHQETGSGTSPTLTITPGGADGLHRDRADAPRGVDHRHGHSARELSHHGRPHQRRDLPIPGAPHRQRHRASVDRERGRHHGHGRVDRWFDAHAHPVGAHAHGSGHDPRHGHGAARAPGDRQRHQPHADHHPGRRDGLHRGSR